MVTSRDNGLTPFPAKPLETIIAMKNTEIIASLIGKGLDEVNHSNKGHLSLPTRRAILQAINEPLVIGRISILCALKVYPIWNEFFKDDTEIVGLIKKTEKYLLGQTDGKELSEDADHLDVLADNYMEDDITAAFAAKVAVRAAYDAGSGADMIVSDYDSDEEVEDPDEWDTAFLASLVYDGGIVDLDSIDSRRNKEFWNWYLTDCIKTACANGRLPYPNPANKATLPAKHIPYRTQPSLWKEDAECRACVNGIKDVLAKMVTFAQWSKCDFYCYTVANTSNADIYYYNGKEPVRLGLDSIRVTLYLSGKAKKLKELMYSLCPQEGAFYLCKVTIDKDNRMDIRFGYDTRNEKLKEVFSDSDFSEDFSKYPRAKEFIPDWLADILRRKRISF